MSGGVDSSVAALILRESGYEAEGVSLELVETRGASGPDVCCSVEAMQDASETARLIGIPHRIINARSLFIEKVIMPFMESYAEGATPNPCILCNERVKFPLLMEEARRAGADFIATGHYARTEGGHLLRGIDRKKDQSYVLYSLSGDIIRRLILPLGGLRKDEVRELARKKGLPVFQRPESQEICFVGAEGYPAFLDALSPSEPGEILDEKGKAIGRHEGIRRYTLGQRKGLGIPSNEPLFVIGIDPRKRSITVGPREKALRKEFRVSGLVLHAGTGKDFRASVKVRSMMEPAECSVVLKTEAVVVMDEPVWAPARGQSAVFYDQDRVIGGGIIESD